MPQQTTGLRIAYLNYGPQSGVTAQIERALQARRHAVTPLQVSGPFEFRDERGRRRITWEGALGLAISLLRFRRQGFGHRVNTTFAFDVHARRAGELLEALPQEPDVVLQNGGLFSPGRPPEHDYVLLLDHTRALSMHLQEQPQAGFPAPLDYGPGWQGRETALYRGACAIATFSQRVADSLQRDYGVPASRIHVVGAGANIYPERLRRRDDGETILFVGKDFQRKGGPVLLRAFEKLRQRRPSARLLIVGPKEALTLPAGATQLGFVPFEQLEDVFAEATAFALPTLREPFGLAFLDAMACGLPCVGTSIEAVPEVVAHEESGLLVPPGDEDALADALLRLLSDPMRARAMGLRGRQRVKAHFNWNKVGERLEDALRQAPRKRRTSAAG